MLVSSCTKGWVIVWDLDTGSCVHSCQGVGPVVDVALNYNHTLLAIGFRGGCIDVGDIEKGSVASLEPQKSSLGADQYRRDAWKTFVGNTHVMFELSNQSENVLTSSSADGITRSWSWTSGDLLTVRDNFDIVVPNCRVVWVESVMKEAVKRCDAEALAFWHQLHSRGCNIVNVAKRGDVVAIATLFHDKSPTIELWDLTELEARKVRRGRGRMLPIAFR